MSPQEIDPDPSGKARLPDGTVIRLRGLRDEDEPLLHDLADHMNIEDLRRRFFTPLKSLPHQLAEKLTHISADRDVALVAQPAESDDALGIVRFAAAPEQHDAEFAIAVRSDWKRRGLGRLLMGQIIAAAREHRLTALYGDVLRDNLPMLQLCRSLGFTLDRHPADAALLRATLIL